MTGQERKQKAEVPAKKLLRMSSLQTMTAWIGHGQWRCRQNEEIPVIIQLENCHGVQIKS